MSDDLRWLASPYDGLIHAFPSGEFDVTAEAMCTHSVPSKRLAPFTINSCMCVACMLVVGDLIADRVRDPSWRT